MIICTIEQHHNHILHIFRRKKWQKISAIPRTLARELLKNCAKFIDFIKNILSNENFIQRHKLTPSDFTRKRSLPFSHIIIFLLNLLRSSLQHELDKFFQVISQSDVPIRTVTASAFCQARKKLKYSAFVELIHRIVYYFYRWFAWKRWHGFRLVAIDGSTVQVPKNEQTERYFGAWHPAKSDQSCPMARVSQMFDVLNHITIDSIMAPKSNGERQLAAKHLAHVDRDDLVLIDRGYPAFWLFQLIVTKGAKFCARLPIDKWTTILSTFLASNRAEQVIDLKPNYLALKKCQQLGLATTPITVRLIRIELDNGEMEVLITSLIDNERYPYEIFKDLYCNRK